MYHCCDLLIRTHATTYTSSSLPNYSYMYRIGTVYIA